MLRKGEISTLPKSRKGDNFDVLNKPFLTMALYGMLLQSVFHVCLGVMFILVYGVCVFTIKLS
jgi:hypothetical protein